MLASSAPPKIGPSRRIQVSIGTVSGCFEPLSLCPFPPRPKDAHVSERDCVVCGGVFGLPIGLVYYRLPARLVCQLSMRPQPHDRDESQATSTSAYVIPTGVIRIPNIAIAGRGLREPSFIPLSAVRMPREWDSFASFHVAFRGPG